MYTKSQRLAAWIACAAFLLVTLCSLLFLVKAANHDCTGEDCPICAQISEAENTLKKLGSGNPSGSTAVVVFILCVIVAPVGGICAVPCATPVMQKVRMND